MGVPSVIHLEIVQSSAIVTIAGHHPFSVALGPYDTIDGRFYQPFILAKQVQKIVAPFITQQPHVVIHYPALAFKQGDERYLITLQIALFISKLGWIIDLITDQPLCVSGDKPDGAPSPYDYLAPFRPPVYQSLFGWILSGIMGVGIIGIIFLYSMGKYKSDLARTQQASTQLQEEINVLEQHHNHLLPLIKQRQQQALFEKKAAKTQARNQVVTAFIDDIVDNIPKDCCLDALEFVDTQHVAVTSEKHHKHPNSKEVGVLNARNIPFVLHGRSLSEKNIPVFFSALLSSPQVESVELMRLPSHTIKKTSSKSTHTFVMKGLLKTSITA